MAYYAVTHDAFQKHSPHRFTVVPDLEAPNRPRAAPPPARWAPGAGSPVATAASSPVAWAIAWATNAAEGRASARSDSAVAAGRRGGRARASRACRAGTSFPSSDAPLRRFEPRADVPSARAIGSIASAPTWRIGAGVAAWAATTVWKGGTVPITVREPPVVSPY